MIVAIVTLVIFLSFLLANCLYKKSNYYYNVNFDYNSLKKIDNKYAIVNLGSTYAKYAFGTYNELKIEGKSFALEGQSLYGDVYVLLNYLRNIKHNGIVIIPLAACVMLYDNHYNIEYLRRKHIINMFPLLQNPKLIKKIIFDDTVIFHSVYGKCSSSLDSNEKETVLNNLEQVWIKLFDLKDLKNDVLSEKNIVNIEKNINYIKQLLNICQSNNLRPVIIVMPFSSRLISKFSKGFLNKVLYEPIKMVVDEGNVLLLDYLANDKFYNSPELFIDGGFRLNKRGSKIFVKAIVNDIENHDAGVKEYENIG